MADAKPAGRQRRNGFAFSFAALLSLNRRDEGSQRKRAAGREPT
jgi:hypothetical protein